MASSTADVAASIAATAAAAGRHLEPEQVAQIALGVEPSDGVMFPGISVFDHREGRIARPLGEPPPMRVLALDFGGVVDTLEFNSVARDKALKSQEPRMSEAVSLIETGLLRGNPLFIGKGATVSAIANQEVSFNPYLDDVLAFSAEVGGFGVNVAHSGTVIGILMPDQSSLVTQAAAHAWKRFDCLEATLRCRVDGRGRLDSLNPKENLKATIFWIPAFAGMTGMGELPIITKTSHHW